MKHLLLRIGTTVEKNDDHWPAILSLQMIYLYEQMHTLNLLKNCERLKAELNRGIYEINALKT